MNGGGEGAYKAGDETHCADCFRFDTVRAAVIRCLLGFKQCAIVA